MSYTYIAFYQLRDANGRFTNFTQTPSVTALDINGNNIPSPAIVNLAVGLYKLSVTQNDLEDVIFRLIPHIDDQANYRDGHVINEKNIHVLNNADGKIDTIDTNVDDIETILGTPTNFMADVSALAVEATVEGLRTIIRQYSSIVSRNISCNQIELRRSSNFEWEVFGVGDLSGRSSLYFTVKYMKEKDSALDSQSVIQIEESAGLLYINKAAVSIPANGSITVTDELAGTMTIELTAEETNKLSPNETYLYDIKCDNNVLAEGKFYVLSSITRTVA